MSSSLQLAAASSSVAASASAASHLAATSFVNAKSLITTWAGITNSHAASTFLQNAALDASAQARCPQRHEWRHSVRFLLHVSPLDRSFVASLASGLGIAESRVRITKAPLGSLTISVAISCSSQLDAEALAEFVSYKCSTASLLKPTPNDDTPEVFASPPVAVSNVEVLRACVEIETEDEETRRIEREARLQQQREADAAEARAEEQARLLAEQEALAKAALAAQEAEERAARGKADKTRADREAASRAAAAAAAAEEARAQAEADAKEKKNRSSACVIS